MEKEKRKKEGSSQNDLTLTGASKLTCFLRGWSEIPDFSVGDRNLIVFLCTGRKLLGFSMGIESDLFLRSWSKLT